MPKFSARSRANLLSCHPDLQVVFNVVIKHFDFSVLCGFRDKEDQDKAFNAGKSKVKYPGSYHNKRPALAVDAVPYPIDWENTPRMKFFIGFVLGIAQLLEAEGVISHRLVSGIDWDGDTHLKDHTFHDHPHFQLIKIP